MTTYFRDFAADTIGALPSDLVHHSASGSWTITVQDIAGVKGLRFAANGSGGMSNWAAFSTIGVVDNTTAKEIVAHMKIVAGETAVNSVPTVALFQSSTDDGCFGAVFEGATPQWRAGRISTSTGLPTGTALAVINPPPFTVAVDTFMRVRLRVTPAGIVRTRIVLGTADSDELAVINALLTAASLPTVGSIDAAKDTPEAWHGSTPADTTYTSGRFAVGAYAHQSENFYSMVGIATAGETAPTTGYAVPTVTDAGDEDYQPGETGINIVGTNFGAAQGSGKVYICPTNNVSDSNRVEQTVTGWSDTSVVFTCVAGTLPRATTTYLFVVNGGGYANATGRSVNIPDTGPSITNAGDETFANGETGIVITGTLFGATQGIGEVLISPTNDVNDGGAVAQTVTAWSNTSITITAVKGALAFLTPAYLFVIDNSGQSNSNGYAVQLVPRVYVQDAVKDLGGNAVALNGEALLVWRSRPSSSNPNPDQVVTLGSIPTGVLNVEINRGSLAVNDPVWCMLVGGTGNKASAKRIVPVYS